MKQRKYTEPYGAIYYEVQFQSTEHKHFADESPARTHTAKVFYDGFYCRVENIDGKDAESIRTRTPKTAVKHSWLTIK